jgi:hypothetical protein
MSEGNMKYQIKNRFTGEIIYEHEGEFLRDAVIAAVKTRADLSGANLSRAYLSRAYLSGANLSGANLSGAYLSRAYLSGANLSGAYLSGANLSRAYLSGADLSGANLSGADLSGANLSRAYLSGAYLSGANLSGADLSGAKGIYPPICTSLLMLYDQPGKIRAYKMVTADLMSPIAPNNGYGSLCYRIGNKLEETGADPDMNLHCSNGINLATLDWCLREWKPGYRIMICEFEAKDIVAIPTATDGKFRVFRCEVVGEKDLAAMGWPLKE